MDVTDRLVSLFAGTGPLSSGSEGGSSRLIGRSGRLAAWSAAVLATLATFAAVVDTATAATGYTSVGTFGTGPGSGPGEFSSPTRIAVDEDTGHVYVVDRENDRVQIFEPSGDSASFLTEITGLDDPFGIAIDQDASPISVYVSLSGPNQIAKLDSDGSATPSFASNPLFVSPAQGGASGSIQSFRAPLAVDPTNGDLLVADPGKDVVSRYSATGIFEGDFDGGDSPDGPFTGVEDIAVAPSGDIFVADAREGSAVDGANSRVDRYSASGAHEANLRPLAGTGDGLLAFDGSSGNLIVADARIFAGGEIRIVDPANGDLVGRVTSGATQLNGLAADAGASGRVYATSDDAQCGFGCGAPTGAYVFAPYELPVAAIEPPSAVGTRTATLEGSVDPNGTETAARFQLSNDAGASWFDVGDATPSPGSGADPVDVSLEATGLSPGTSYLVRLATSNASATETFSAAASFSTDAVTPPTVVLNPPANVTSRSAELSAEIDPHGDPTPYRFEYTSDGGANWTDAGTQPEISSAQTVTRELTGLVPGTTYEVRVVATNGGGETIEGGQSFSTPTAAPSVTTRSAGELTPTSATLRGYVNPNGQETTYYFEYGPDTGYGSRIPVAGDPSAGDGLDPAPVQQALTGLAPETTIHYRLVAENATGTSAGDDRTFTTLATAAPCANQAIRAAQGSTYLPDCRAYEKVSPAAKGDADVGGYTKRGYAQASVDGNGLVYTSSGSYPGVNRGGALPFTYRALRGAGGWVNDGLSPPSHSTEATCGTCSLGNTGQVADVTDDLERAIVMTNAPLVPGATNATNIYIQDNPGNVTELVTSGGPSYGEVLANNRNYMYFQDATADFSHVFFRTSKAMAPGAVEGAYNIYDYSEGQLRLVNTDASGHLAADEGYEVGVGNLPLHGFYAQSNNPARHAVSEDGSRVFFFVPGARPGGWTFVRIDGTETKQFPGSSFFMAANPDGTKAIVSDDHGMRLWDVDTMASQQICAGVSSQCAYVESSEDLSRIYYASGDDLYLWQGGVPHLIARAEPGSFSYSILPGMPGIVTADGDRLTFFARGVNGIDTGGVTQIYRYDASEDEVECLSCPPDGVPQPGRSTQRDGITISTGPATTYPHVLHNIRNIDENADQVVFQTDQSLVARDTNGVTDVYAWKDGSARLVSSGTSRHPANFVDADEDGDNIFFVTRARLLRSDTDDYADMYVARVDGGFEEEGPAVPCDPDCRAAEQPNSGVLAPETSTHVGPGNVKAPSCRARANRVKAARMSLRKADSQQRRDQARARLKKAKSKLAACRGGVTS